MVSQSNSQSRYMGQTLITVYLEFYDSKLFSFALDIFKRFALWNMGIEDQATLYLVRLAVTGKYFATLCYK